MLARRPAAQYPDDGLHSFSIPSHASSRTRSRCRAREKRCASLFASTASASLMPARMCADNFARAMPFILHHGNAGILIFFFRKHFLAAFFCVFPPSTTIDSGERPFRMIQTSRQNFFQRREVIIFHRVANGEGAIFLFRRASRRDDCHHANRVSAREMRSVVCFNARQGNTSLRGVTLPRMILIFNQRHILNMIEGEKLPAYSAAASSNVPPRAASRISFSRALRNCFP